MELGFHQSPLNGKCIQERAKRGKHYCSSWKEVMTNLGTAGKLAQSYINSKLTPLMIAASVLLGIGAVIMLPREEEPQIIVPMIDIFVEMPGASPKEVEERVTKPMEKLLWEIPGVEYVYSTSSPGMAMAVIRFLVGTDEEDAIVRVNQKMFANLDLIPHGASPPLIKPRSIDDVPILALTLWSETADHFTLRRIAAQLHDEIKKVTDVSEVTLIGGQRRQVKVILDEVRMAAYGVAPANLPPLLQAANYKTRSGKFASGNKEFIVTTGSLFRCFGWSTLLSQRYSPDRRRCRRARQLRLFRTWPIGDTQSPAGAWRRTPPNPYERYSPGGHDLRRKEEGDKRNRYR
jgi:multidrug efflux pump subunit AcrB